MDDFWIKVNEVVLKYPGAKIRIEKFATLAQTSNNKRTVPYFNKILDDLLKVDDANRVNQMVDQLEKLFERLSK